MDTIQKDTLVSIRIKLEDEQGNLIDESDELIYIHGGYEQIFQKLEEHLEGKSVGESFQIRLTQEEAFGVYDEKLVLKEALEDLPEDIEVGTELDGEEEGIVYVIESIEDGYAILNANHELAGIALHVSGEILELEHLTPQGVEEILKAQHHH